MKWIITKKEFIFFPAAEFTTSIQRKRKKAKNQEKGRGSLRLGNRQKPKPDKSLPPVHLKGAKLRLRLINKVSKGLSCI
jgi:hypothetical protein